jgi:hypothetical protein
MNLLPNEIRNYIEREKNNPEVIVKRIKYILIRHMHISPTEVKILPLEEVLPLITGWNKEQEEYDKELKKNGK